MESLATSSKLSTYEHIDPDFATDMAGWAAEKKALNIRLYSVGSHCSYADYVMVCSGTSDRHVLAIAEYLRDQSKKRGHLPLGTEGFQQGHWVLLDFGEIIVHVFYEPVRDYYELDRMWSHAEQVEILGTTASTQGLARTSAQQDLDEDDE
jgi:ribosome-associated protein